MSRTQSEIGQYLRSLRKEKGQTLHQVAKVTDIDSPLISKIERSERIPTAEQIKKFSKYYKVDESRLKVMAAAEKIIKEYGVNDTTYEAANLVMEQITPYLKMIKHTTDKTELILQDALQGLSELSDLSFDLAICDPPYGAATSANWNYDRTKKMNGFGGNWQLNNQEWDLLTGNDLFKSTYLWLAQLKRLVKPTGSIWIHSTYHNAGFVNVVCQLLGLEIINEVVWYKRNAFPNLSARRLTASHETILWVHTGGNKRLYNFNYDDVKKAKFASDNMKEADKQLRTVWDVPNNKGKDELQFGTHPTQKPMRIAERLLLVSGIKGGKLLVPFAGSGTEMIAGIKYGMQSVGFEINEEYFKHASERILFEEKKVKSQLFQECVKPKNIVEPVIKWSGSKRYVAPELSKYISIQKRYIEPFIGGGAMLPFRQIPNALASDIIPELVNLWKQIQRNPVGVAEEYQARWDRLQKEGHSVYYEFRDSFNKTKNEFDFLFLTRTCVNGLIRYNTSGEFNNSMHKNRPGINPKTFKEILLKWSHFIKNVEFRKCDYRETLADANKNDFVFLDPPYGGTKDRYTKTEFVLQDFYNELERLNSVGAKWILTFDGTAGNREYNFQLPQELYKHKTEIKTGNSPFTKSMRTSIDAVYESVYFNFQSNAKLRNNIQKNVIQEFAFV